MKYWYWYAIAIVVLFAGGFVTGAFVHPGFNPGGTIVTNYIKGTNTVIYIQDYADATNAENYPKVFDAYKHFNSDPFIFIQQNDTMTVNLWSRSATSRIKQWQSQNGFILGGGWNIWNALPVIAGGYHFGQLSILGVANISTNFGISVLGLWMF